MKFFLKFVFLAMGFVAILLCGCSPKAIMNSDLIGSYRATLPNDNSEMLELLADGNCSQEIIINGIKYDARGTWKFDDKLKRLYIKGIRSALTPTETINPDISSPPSDATLGTPVSRTLAGKIVIMLSENINYEKVKSEPTSQP